MKVFVEEDFCKQVMLQTAQSVLKNKLSKSGAADFLAAARENLVLLASIWGPMHGITIDPSTILKQIPHTREAVFNQLGLQPDIITQACCLKCFLLYPLPSKDYVPPKQCIEPFLSSYQTYCKWAKENELAPKCDKDLFKTSTQGNLKPVRTFSYMGLETWLRRRLSEPHFEALLDSSLSAQDWAPDCTMEDVWHGRVWQEFPSKNDGTGIYTNDSGNLVFSLYLDWFNAEGASSLGPHNSVGAITLICLNLPPQERYRIDNTFLFAVIPGPKEPSLEQVNHLLKPLIDELQSFWKGIFFKSTASHPSGRVIRAAVFPLIADLPALRKAAGFASHAATLFCSFYLLDKEDIENCVVSEFPMRNDEEHLKRADEWRKIDNHKGQKKFMKTHGVRWSVLNNLPYWHPVQYCSIELMHALILGDLKDHTKQFMNLASASQQLKSMQEKDEEWQLDDHYTALPFTELFPPAPKPRKGKQKRTEEEEEPPATIPPPKQGRNLEPSQSTTLHKGKQRADIGPLISTPKAKRIVA